VKLHNDGPNFAPKAGGERGGSRFAWKMELRCSILFAYDLVLDMLRYTEMEFHCSILFAYDLALDILRYTEVYYALLTSSITFSKTINRTTKMYKT